MQGYKYFLLELDGSSTTSSQAHMIDGMVAATTAVHTAKDASEVLELLENRKKLKKLQVLYESQVTIVVCY